MSGFGKLTNSVIAQALRIYEKLGFGKPLFTIFALSAEMFYSTFSKISIGDSANNKFERYVLTYKKLHQQDIEGEKPVAIVTGANSGIGYITSKALVLAGYHVIFACRNEKLAIEAMQDIERETGIEACEFIQLDLASFDSIRAFVTKFKNSHSKLNLLINNAGVMMCPYMTTKEGIELQFGINHVGHFILTNGLLDVLEASAPARIINVSSLAQFFGDNSFERVLDPTKYDKVINYGNSKLANIMFTTLLAKKLAGTGVTVNSLHPGSVDTNLTRHAPLDSSFIMKFLKSLLLISPTAGALTTIKLALDPELENVTGKYFARENETVAKAITRDEAKCQELWDFTEDIIEKNSKK